MATLQGHPTVFGGGTSDVQTSPGNVGAAAGFQPYAHAFGTRARDSAGNEYVYCNFDGNVYPEILVNIASDFTCSVLGTGGASGPCGIIVGTNGQSGLPLTSAPVSPMTSDQGGWVQIYGVSYLQVGSNASSPSDVANGPTTVRTSLCIKFALATSATTPPGVLTMVSDDLPTSTTNWKIYGINVATDASPAAEVSICTAVSATHIGSHVRVFLNYPYIEFAEITS